jgi:hypothetical protein
MASKALKLAVGLLTCVSVSVPPSLAEARPFWGGGGWGHGWHGGYGPGWYRPHVFHGWRGYYGRFGYPAYYGGYYPGYYYGGPIYYRRRSNTGAALAAGLIGGIALGAILANATRSQRVYYRPVRYRRR